MNASVADDPEEVDISTHRQANTGAQPGENPFMAAMPQIQQQRQQQQGQTGANPSEDPMMRMMQQMMGAMGGQPQDPNNPNMDQSQQLPGLLQAMMANNQQSQQQQSAPATSSAYMWRIVHAIVALILASYIAFTSTFNGSKLSRTQNVYTQESGHGFGPRLFVTFVSAQLVLQTSRYLMEKGQLQGSGIFATIANSGVIPEPFSNYIRLMGRYIGIAKMIFSDMMVVIFVFGGMAWWKGMAAS